MVLKFKLFIVLLFFSSFGYSQSLSPIYQKLVDSIPDQVFGFAILKSDSTKRFLLKNNCKLKYESDTHFFVNAPLKWMDSQSKLGKIPHFNFDPMSASLLGDTVRESRFVNPVHAGIGGLDKSFTGQNVIIGFIDVGIDYNHPDFKDLNGDTRILRLWDQTIGTSFTHYGYGKLWDSTSINNGSCTYVPSSDHGSTVAGIGAGSGLANGKNKGIAPDANIVFINLSLTTGYQSRIVDACDYIFKFADSLGLPAVVNIGVGSPYGGGHDGNDPYTAYVENLISLKEGRVVCASAGNYGAYGNYHLRGEVTLDTTFTWFKPNPSYGNIVYFEIYSDTSESHFDFAIGADKPAPNYGFRGRTEFMNTHSQMNTPTIDTIWNGVNRIAVVNTYREIVDSAFHMEVYISPIDSVSYNFRFMTKGVGSYDLWNSRQVYTNDIIQTLPSSSVVPEIINYQLPDSIDILAAYFMNSEKIVTVGNFNNRQSYIDFNGGIQDFSAFPTGKINPTSSRGPNRLNYLKPDVSANGNLSFAAASLSTLSNPANYTKILQEGWHIRNGGTSMAAPVVSGMAALYLEKCPTSRYCDFKRDLIDASEKDHYTGPTANYSYGYGKPNALKLLLDKDNIPLIGTSFLCGNPINISTNLCSNIDSVIWSTSSNMLSLNVNTPGNYSAEIFYGSGCKAYSDTLEIIDILPDLPTVLNYTQPDCLHPFGEIQISPQPNVNYNLGGKSQLSPVFSNLPANIYTVSVKSQLDTMCYLNSTVSIELFPPENMVINPIQSVSFCDTFVLEPISGYGLTGTEAYFTQKSGKGIKFISGSVIDTSISKLYMFDSLGVCVDQDSIFFTFIPGDDAKFYYGDFCNGEIVAPTITGILGGVFSFEETPSNEITIDQISGEVLNYLPNNSYIIRYTTQGDCPRYQLDTFLIHETPMVPITNLDTIVYVDFESELKVMNDQGGLIEWYLDSMLLDKVFEGNSFYSVIDRDVYVVETINGCKSYPKRIVFIDDKGGLNLTISAITPNGDNVNDSWLLKGIDSEYPNNVVQIFNQWGMLIFESLKGEYEQNSWSGKYKNELLPIGSYYYKINCNDLKGTVFQGTITIIR
jgi:gliding motility-associated-like protein